MHRTFVISFSPLSCRSAKCFTDSRKEAARLWYDLIIRHHRIRRLRWRWPNSIRFIKWAKGRYPGLAAQSVQQIVIEFLEAVSSAVSLRKQGRSEAAYPWKRPKYRDVVYTNQSARLKNGYLILPNGKSGTLAAKLPKRFAPEGRLMEVRLSFGKVILTYRSDDPPLSAEPQTTIGIDLGVNTLLAATDGERSILVSGREAKATVQWRSKRLSSLQEAQGRKTKGSRRWRRLQARKRRMLTKARNRTNDLVHKATRKVADFFPGARAFVGEPFNDAARKMGRVQAQQVSSACNRKIINLLDYKLRGGVIEVNEAYSSQTCPVCGCRQKCRRTYECRKCGFAAPRDVVGSLNIRSIGLFGEMRPTEISALRTTNVVPIKYPGVCSPGSSGGSPASSSPGNGREALCAS